MSILPKAIYIFNAIPIKITPAFLTQLEKNNPRICMEPEKTLNSQSNLEKESQSRRHHNSGLQAVLQSCNHQDRMILAQKQTLMEWVEWNRIENTEMDPQTYGRLIFDEAGKNIQWNKDSLFSKWCWENWTATCRKMNLDHFLTPYTHTHTNQNGWKT